MSSARVIRQRLLMCLGLAMIIAGVTAASMGYLAATDAKSRVAVVVTPTHPTQPAKQPTTKRATASATTRKTTIAKSKRTTAAAKSAAAKRRAAAAAASATTRNSAGVITVDANASADANATVSRRYHGMMWWGGAMLAVGLASVGYSIHERKPKAPTTGSDELLNDAPPF